MTDPTLINNQIIFNVIGDCRSGIAVHQVMIPTIDNFYGQHYSPTDISISMIKKIREAITEIENELS